MGSPRIRPRSLFSKTFNGFLFGWSLTAISRPLAGFNGASRQEWDMKERGREGRRNEKRNRGIRGRGTEKMFDLIDSVLGKITSSLG